MVWRLIVSIYIILVSYSFFRYDRYAFNFMFSGFMYAGYVYIYIHITYIWLPRNCGIIWNLWFTRAISTSLHWFEQNSTEHHGSCPKSGNLVIFHSFVHQICISSMCWSLFSGGIPQGVSQIRSQARNKIKVKRNNNEVNKSITSFH